MPAMRAIGKSICTNQGKRARFELAYVPKTIIAGRSWQINPEEQIVRSDLWEVGIL